MLLERHITAFWHSGTPDRTAALGLVIFNSEIINTKHKREE